MLKIIDKHIELKPDADNQTAQIKTLTESLFSLWGQILSLPKKSQILI